MTIYTLKLASGTSYKMYEEDILVKDTVLAEIFGEAGEAYFTFDFNSGTPSSLTELSITNTSDITVMEISGLTAGTVKENCNFKGEWDGTSTTFTSFVELGGQAIDEAQLSFLMGKIKEAGSSGDDTRILTTDDYNYPTDNPSCVALWLLEPGTYSWKSEVAFRANSSWSDQTNSPGVATLWDAGNGQLGIVFWYKGGESWYQLTNPTTGQADWVNRGLLSTNVYQGGDYTKVRIGSGASSTGNNAIAIGTRATTSGTQSTAVGYQADAPGMNSVALGVASKAKGTGVVAIGFDAIVESSSQGSVALGAGAYPSGPGEVNIGTFRTALTYSYNNSGYRLLRGVYDGQSDHDAATYGQLISYSAINGAGAPTTATEGKYVGQLYYDTTNENMYFLKTIDTTTTPATYTWETLGGGGGGGSSTIIGHGMPKSTTVAEQGQFYLDTDGNALYLCDSVSSNTTTWSLVPKEDLIQQAEITYYPNWEKVVYTKQTYESELTDYDIDKWSEWSSQHPLDEWMADEGYQFEYSSGVWTFWGEEPVTISENEMYNTTGLQLSANTDGAWCRVDMTIDIDKTSTETTAVLGESQFKKLCFEGKDAVVGPFGEDSVMILQSAIKSVTIYNDTLTEIPDNFLTNCYNLDGLYTLAEGSLWGNRINLKGIKKVGNNFLRGCLAIEGHFNNGAGLTNILAFWLDTVEEIGDYFFAEIGDNQGTYSGNFAEISVQVGTPSIGSHFFANVASNVAFSIYSTSTSGYKSFGSDFCANSAFTEISFGTYLPPRIEDRFLYGCADLTTINGMSATNLGRVETIGDFVFYGCRKLDRALSFTKVKSIGLQFLADCIAFNSTLELPSVTDIGGYFLYGATAFNKGLTLYRLQSIGQAFMQNCQAYTSTITLHEKYIFLPSDTGQQSTILSMFGGGSSTAPAYTTGITIAGEGRSAFLALGNRTSSPYRKLIDAGA